MISKNTTQLSNLHLLLQRFLLLFLAELIEILKINLFLFLLKFFN